MVRHSSISLRLHFPNVVKKRGRLKGNKGYFAKYKNNTTKGLAKSAHEDPISSVVQELLNEEDETRQHEQYFSGDDIAQKLATKDIGDPEVPFISDKVKAMHL